MPSLRGMIGRAGFSVLALVAAAEVCLVGWWVSGGNPALGVPLQIIMLMVAGLAVLVLRYASLKRRHLGEVRARAAESERTRLAEDMHDLLGHELSLIALEAGRLQVTYPQLASDAAAIRNRAGLAVERLQEIVGILGEPSAREHPVGESVNDLIESATRAGMSVRAELSSLGDITEPVRLTVVGLVREGLTNAARHTPGAQVVVRTARHGDSVTVDVENPAPDTSLGGGSGLASWERRVRLLSGDLDAGAEDGVFRLQATLPADTRLANEPTPIRAPIVELIRGAALPIIAVLGLLIAFWSWSTHDAELSAHDFARIHSGQSEAAALRILPEREARIRLNREPGRPAGSTCRTYSDGNFPLGQSTYRICFAGGVVVTTEDLRE
jgi:hypothetical protein